MHTVEFTKAVKDAFCAAGRTAVLCLFLVVFCCAWLTSNTANAAPVIGSASTVVRDVQGRLTKDWRTVVINDNIHQDEIIKTGEDSAARIVFADRTDFMIGANSQVVLDKFLYDSSSNSGQLVLRATKGLMKFRTGRMPSRSYKINTPVATVGIRGTEFVLRVLASGATMVHVISGEVFVVDAEGKSVQAEVGSVAIVYPPNQLEAEDGPLLIQKNQHVLDPDAREMVAQIVFSQDASKTQLTVNDTGNNPKVSFNNGNIGVTAQKAAPVTIRPVKTPPRIPGIPDNNSVAPLDPLIDARNTASSQSSANLIANGGFENGFNGWTVTGAGMAKVIEDPDNPANHVAELTSGSTVMIEQSFQPNGQPFEISFDYAFLDGDGILEILLAAGTGAPIVLESIDGTGAPDDVVTLTLPRIYDPTLIGLPDLILRFVFGSDEQGRRVVLDNINVESVPTPVPQAAGMLGLLIAAGTIVGIRRRRKRRSAGNVS